MPKGQRAAETLEADVVAEARKIGSGLMPGFVPTAEIQFLEKNEFVMLLAKGSSDDYKKKLYRDVVNGETGRFDPVSNKAFVTFTEKCPSYRMPLVSTVHEREGHGYIMSMRAVKEEVELAEKALQQHQKAVDDSVKEKADEVMRDNLAKLHLAQEVIQFFNEGFAYWTDVKAVELIKSDKKRFCKYGQTRIDAWSPFDCDPSEDIGEESEYDRYLNDRYRHNSWYGLVFYSEIEKKFGESAVPISAKACLDVPLDELFGKEMADLFFTNVMNGEYVLAGNVANAATFRYADKKLKELSAILKPVENDSYTRSLLAETIRKGEDAFCGPKEPR